VSRTARLTLQIAILGVGAYLVLRNEMTAGMIFASSMISARALQPLDQIIGSWRQIIDANLAWKRLSTLRSGPDYQENVALPAPEGALSVDQIVYHLPGAADGSLPLIKRLTFEVAAGETVAIVGPSQAGKSTLARLIVGAIEPRSGAIRIDGGDIRNWDPEELGRHIGYLPQDVELFPGTIAQNIARFEPDAPDGKLVQAAQRAQVHGLILGQRDGYSTLIGPTGVRLSGGERQRIGLARAFYGDPKVLVLDEPNANLDANGEAALERAIIQARLRKTTVLVITHRPSLAA
ncbi:MAG: ATP-binding cassette domain-containing protein, partial [Mesorhizobium sp.]